MGFLFAIFGDPERIKQKAIVDYSSDDCSEEQIQNSSYLITSRSWLDYSSNEFCTKYITSEKSFNKAQSLRNNYQDNISATSEEFWGHLYNDLYNTNKNAISGLIDSLYNIRVKRQLDDVDFANMIVTFVQDIPYTYILDAQRCEDQDDTYGGCLEDVKFGILSPIEFLHTLKGDCDTRTVLLYTILKELGFEPKIAISEAYEHSVLLLNIPSGGNDYIYDKSRKFYFWETTAPGWPSGVLPPDMRDIGKWFIALN